VSVVQIAELAGVSIATVSRVMNNNPRVNPQIADKVRAAMGELGISMGPPRNRAIFSNLGSSADRRLRTIALIAIGQQYSKTLS
jgi:LacI family transcriptional regulator